MEDLTHLLERLEVFEERCAVTFEALFARLDGGFLSVTGELRPRDGTQLKQNLEIIVDVYDHKKRLISRQKSSTYWAERFIGFETFQIMATNIAIEIAKIRIYPKPEYY